MNRRYEVGRGCGLKHALKEVEMQKTATTN
jgi:hypothetical protein